MTQRPTAANWAHLDRHTKAYDQLTEHGKLPRSINWRVNRFAV